MGNAPSTQSDHSTSIRSRASRRAQTNNDKFPDRASHAVSFYQTPPGSFDTGFTPTFTPRSETTSPTSSEPASVEQNTQKPATLSAVSPEMPQAEASPSNPVRNKTWKPGVYTIVNTKSGNALDLSAADDKSLIGFPLHGGKNQQVRLLRFHTKPRQNAEWVVAVDIRNIRGWVHDTKRVFWQVSLP